MTGEHPVPKRVLTRLLVQPGDIGPRFDGFEVIGTFNPAAIEFNGGVALLIRVVERPTESREGHIALPEWDQGNSEIKVEWHALDDVELVDPRVVRLKRSGRLRLTFISYLLPAFSGDGLQIDRYGSAPMLPASSYESFGIEDPRLAKFDDRYYFTYVAVSANGIVTALASTVDFQTFDRHGVIFCPENKDVVLFPEKISGEYVALHRPNPASQFSPPEIWLARSPDLLHWGQHKRLLGREAAWATLKVGAGTPPIRTPDGWLSLYHGNVAPKCLHATSVTTTDVGEYAAASLLQSLADPSQIVGMSPLPVMRAEADFERSGYLPDIIFPTAMLRRGEYVDIYYGAADTATGVARYTLADLLSASGAPI
jgi:beta-1,2-mannobiose phosphorylase / 1,2-beta-oligomannan phosphorylase